MSYQAVIRDAANGLVINRSVGMRISILQGSPTGTEVYREIYNSNPSTNTNGLVAVEIGGGVAVLGSFSTINWAAGTYFLRTETDPAGGTNYTVVGVKQLLSVPYALHARMAESVTGGVVETDPVWTASSGNYYTKSDISSSGASQVHFNNLTHIPTTLAGYGITDAVMLTGNQTVNGIKTFMNDQSGDTRTNYGFIAQDIEELVGTENNMVTTGGDPDRTLGLRYTDLIAPMVKAIQEQQKEIQELKQLIKSLTQK